MRIHTNSHAEKFKLQPITERAIIRQEDRGTRTIELPLHRHIHKDELSEYVQNRDTRSEVFTDDTHRFYERYYASEAEFEMSQMTKLAKLNHIQKLELEKQDMVGTLISITELLVKKIDKLRGE